jgi:hypothetical protein
VNCRQRTDEQVDQSVRTGEAGICREEKASCINRQKKSQSHSYSERLKAQAIVPAVHLTIEKQRKSTERTYHALQSLSLAEAQASAARELARLDGVAPDSPEEIDILHGARSQILRTAIAGAPSVS